MSLSAERAEDRAMAEAAAKGIARERRGVQEGADAAAPPLLDRASLTGEDTEER
jgi:hypothetical protein